MNPNTQERPLYKHPTFLGVAAIFIVITAVAVFYSMPTLELGMTSADGSIADKGELTAGVPPLTTRLEMKRKAISEPQAKVIFSDTLVQSDFEKISSQYAECLANIDCAIQGGLWNLYVAIQGKSAELGAETVQYYVINLLNHMMRKMEGAPSYRESYRGSARKIIEDLNKDLFALSPDWIILADIAYQAGDLEEAKSLYKQTLEMARQSSSDSEEQIDVETLMRVKSRCYELGCEVSADLDPVDSTL